MSLLLPALLAGGSLLSSISSQRANRASVEAQTDASNRGIDEQRRQFDLTRQMYQPYVDAGASTLNRLVRMAGAEPRLERRLGRPVATYSRQTGDNIQDAFRMTTDARNRLENRTADARTTLNNKLSRARTGMFNRADRVRGRQFEADPGYQFRREQGERAINRGAAARGNVYSGATMQALNDFNSGLASQEYANFDARRARDYGTELGRAYNTYNVDAGRAGTIYNADMTNAGLNYDARMGQVNDNYARRDNRSANLLKTRVGNIGAGYDAGQNQLNSLLSLANLGRAGASGTVAGGSNMASNVGNLYGNIGQAESQGAITGGNIFNSLINNGFGIAGAANMGMFGANPFGGGGTGVNTNAMVSGVMNGANNAFRTAFG